MLDDFTPIEQQLKKAKAAYKKAMAKLPRLDDDEEELDWQVIGQWAVSGGGKNMTMEVHEDVDVPEGEKHPQPSEEEYEDACHHV